MNRFFAVGGGHSILLLQAQLPGEFKAYRPGKKLIHAGVRVCARVRTWAYTHVCVREFFAWSCWAEPVKCRTGLMGEGGICLVLPGLAGLNDRGV